MTYKLPEPRMKHYIGALLSQELPLYSEAQVLQAYRDGLERAAGLVEDPEVPTYTHGGKTYDDTVLLLANIARAIRALKEQQA